MATFELPLVPQAQKLSIKLGANTYLMTFEWNSIANAWQISLADRNGVPILGSIPVVTGTDLLAAYGYMNLGGGLIAASDDNIHSPPTYDNLGTLGRVYFVTVD